MIKRMGIDKAWTRAPYDISSEAQAACIAEWLKKSLPPFEWHVARDAQRRSAESTK
jgi:hypothetical protein